MPSIRYTFLLVLFLLAGTVLVQAQGETVKLGLNCPITGPYMAQGADQLRAAKMAVEEVNAKGLKIGGQEVKLELVSEDDQADPRTATTVAQRLTDEGVKGVVGHVTSGACHHSIRTSQSPVSLTSAPGRASLLRCGAWMT